MSDTKRIALLIFLVLWAIFSLAVSTRAEEFTSPKCGDDLALNIPVHKKLGTSHRVTGDYGGFGGGVPAGAAGFCDSCVGCKVCWDMTATGLDIYDADDGATTTLNSVSFTSEGMEVNASGDYAYFQCTEDDSIDSTNFEIGFKFKSTAARANYRYAFQHNQVVGASQQIGFINYESANGYRLYLANDSYTLTSTISAFDGAEHSFVITYNRGTSTASLSIDGETPVTASSTSQPAIATGNLYIGYDIVWTNSGMIGIFSDFYIK